jgi:hypothetical protein
MRTILFVFFVFLMACGAASTESQAERTLPDPLFTQQLPDSPEEVPPDKRMSVAAVDCVQEDSDPPVKLPPGILISQEMGLRAARLKVSYDELRGLYRTDLATMDRERSIYEKHLEAADGEIAVWRERSKRTWLERNGGLLGIGVGFVLGAAITVAIVAAVEGTTEAIR